MPRNSCSIWHAEEFRSTCAISSHKHLTSRPADWQSADSHSSFTLTKIQDSMKGNRRRRQSLLRVGGGPFSVLLVQLDMRVVVGTGCTRTLPDASDFGQKDRQEAGGRECYFHLSSLKTKNIVFVKLHHHLMKRKGCTRDANVYCTGK